ncbi:MAG: hypothetical protein ABFR36_07150 [Acidobacteriota bacterium]
MNNSKLLAGHSSSEKILLLIFICFTIFFVAGCVSEVSDNPAEVEKVQPDPVDENALMDSVLRIDILSMDVNLVYVPGENIVRGESELKFKMRSGQTIPQIHFDLNISDLIESVELNGEVLDFNNSADVKVISFDETTQDGIELLRTCDENNINQLKIVYTISHTDQFKSFYSNVNDIYGVGNEVVFPTINCPSDLIRHRIAFSVESDAAYSFIGSGYITGSEKNGVKKWLLDTERDVASYTVMWMLAPADDVEVLEREVNGVDVRIMTYKDSVPINSAFEILESWLPELEEKIGKFPMERGLDVFLTQRGGGMEYFGGTITSLGALEHEVFHMYYGCSVVAKTYRDSWWDEAINMWYEYSAADSISPVGENFSSNIVSCRTPVSVGFNDRAYNDGAKVIESIASEMGGRDVFIDFLKQLYSGHKFLPFNTFELVEYIFNYSGIDFEERMIKWLYQGARTYYSSQSSEVSNYHKVDMTPPDNIRIKYQ